MDRCFDCLVEFSADQERFAVLKKMRDMPPEADPAEARLLEGLLYDQVLVCDDCAGWYREGAIKVTP